MGVWRVYDRGMEQGRCFGRQDVPFNSIIRCAPVHAPKVDVLLPQRAKMICEKYLGPVVSTSPETTGLVKGVPETGEG